jgi:hypothetical protein
MTTNVAVDNGAKWRDQCFALLSSWTKRRCDIEKSNMFKQIDGAMFRADVFIHAGVLKHPFDGGVIVEAKSQVGKGSACEKIYKDYINALFRSPYAVLFACDSNGFYDTFCEWVNDDEAKTISRVCGSKSIEATIGSQQLCKWFQANRPNMYGE